MEIFHKIGMWMRAIMIFCQTKIDFKKNAPMTDREYLNRVLPGSIDGMERIMAAEKARRVKMAGSISHLANDDLTKKNKNGNKPQKPSDTGEKKGWNPTDGEKAFDFIWSQISARYKIPLGLPGVYKNIISKLIEERVDGNLLRLIIYQLLGAMAATEAWRASQSSGSASIMALAEIAVLKEKLDKITYLLEHKREKDRTPPPC